MTLLNRLLLIQNLTNKEDTHPRPYLRASFLPVGPFTSNYKEIPGGPILTLTETIMQNIGFTYSVDMPLDKSWGIRFPNGSWNGFVAMLLRNDTDLVLGPFGINEDRAKFIRYTRPHFITEISILASSGQQEPTSFFTFLLSFDIKIWFAVTLAFIVMVLVSAVSDMLSKKYSFIKRTYDYLWMYLSASFSEGSPRYPRSEQGKLLLSLWLITILILNNVFAALFKAVLTVDTDADLIHTVEQLANQENLMLILPAASIFEYIFKFSEKKEYQRLYQRALTNRKETLIQSSLTTQWELYQKIKSGKAVFAYNSPIGQYYIGKFCDQLRGERKFYFMEETFFPYGLAFAVRKDFPEILYKNIDNRIQFALEAGLITKWIENELLDYHKCQARQLITDEPSLKLVHLISVFYLFLSLQLLSVFAFLLELKYKKNLL